jgi:FkbM family methyltransferase
MSKMNADLIYDIGIHRGEDTARYLDMGYRVLGVDANPVMIERCKERFAAELTKGQLSLLNVGIAEKPGLLPFYRHASNDEWSSFNQDLGWRQDGRGDVVQVDVVPFSHLLSAFGVPFYLKIDIEGNDLHCIDALSREDLPRYVSTEAYTTDAFCWLRALGYSRFKLLNQQPLGAGKSGPFGEDTPGEWRDISSVSYEWLHLYFSHRDRCTIVDPSIENWFDLHAALE